MRSHGAGPRSGSVVELAAQILAGRAVFPVYQPIVDLADGQIVGVEALARGPAGSALESPEALLAAAAQAGILERMDQVTFGRAVEVALATADRVPPLLFVNAEPAAIGAPIDPALLALMRAPKPFRVVMEYTERALGMHPENLLNLARRGWSDGNALALDDVGADPVSLALLPLFAPEVIKLDQCFMRDPALDAANQTTTIVQTYANDAGAIVLAEGIETEQDVERARSLGAQWGQGWLYGRPAGLAAIAGRPMTTRTVLRPPPRDALTPETAPFATLERAGSVQRCDHAGTQRLLEKLIATAECGGQLAVVVGSYSDELTGRAWLNRLNQHNGPFAYVGLVGPSLAGVDAGQVRLIVPSSSALTPDATLTVVCPGEASALGIRRRAGDEDECVTSDDPHLVHALARALLRTSSRDAGRRRAPER